MKLTPNPHDPACPYNSGSCVAKPCECFLVWSAAVRATLKDVARDLKVSQARLIDEYTRGELPAGEGGVLTAALNTVSELAARYREAAEEIE